MIRGPSVFSGCKEMSRGYDWVKLLVTLERGFDADTVMSAHAEYSERHATDVNPEIMSSGLWENRIVFKFKTAPYSTESNDFFRYVDGFGKWAFASLCGSATDDETFAGPVSLISRLFADKNPNRSRMSE